MMISGPLASEVASLSTELPCTLNTRYEHRCEKPGLRGFRPGPTQTRNWLQARLTVYPPAYQNPVNLSNIIFLALNFFMHIFNIAKSEQSSHTPGGSHQRPNHFNLKEKWIKGLITICG